MKRKLIGKQAFAIAALNLLESKPRIYYYWGSICLETKQEFNSRYPDGWAYNFLPNEVLHILVDSGRIYYDSRRRAVKLVR